MESGVATACLVRRDALAHHLRFDGPHLFPLQQLSPQVTPVSAVVENPAVGGDEDRRVGQGDELFVGVIVPTSCREESIPYPRPSSQQRSSVAEVKAGRCLGAKRPESLGWGRGCARVSKGVRAEREGNNLSTKKRIFGILSPKQTTIPCLIKRRVGSPPL